MREFTFYIDDSGTRHPDRKPGPSSFNGDWFALGGVLIAREDEQRARDMHAAFCARWKIDYALHSVEIRHRSKNFAWVGELTNADLMVFYRDLDDLVCNAPLVVLGCVIDRPGYNARYAKLYGDSRWSLCKTAFPIIAERSVKFAKINDARIRLAVERSDKRSEALIRSHFDDLRAKGMPFSAVGNAKYAALGPEEMRNRLYDLKFKFKSSPMVQMADLMLYPLCKGAYENDYRPFKTLRDKGRLIEAVLPSELISTVGTKLSCFDENRAAR